MGHVAGETIPRSATKCILEFRAEFFNLLNHVNYLFEQSGAISSEPTALELDPNNINTPQNAALSPFGYAQAARPPRQVQFALKFYFELQTRICVFSGISFMEIKTKVEQFSATFVACVGAEEQEARGLRYTPKEIYQQPETWQSTYKICRERGPELAAISTRPDKRAPSDQPGPKVFLVGAGTSDYVGRALTCLLEVALALRSVGGSEHRSAHQCRRADGPAGASISGSHSRARATARRE